MKPIVSLHSLQRVLRHAQLTRCFYLAVFCPTHGEVGLAVEKLPRNRRQCECPLCSENSVFAILGTGGTSAQLPYFSTVTAFTGRTPSGAA
jgi:hypothetical protein